MTENIKYNLSFDKRDFDAAIEVVNKTNLSLCEAWTSELLLNFIKSIAFKNATFIKDNDTEKWIAYTYTGGITLIFSSDGYTPKGYPIIDVEITVSPSFNGSKYTTVKVR